MSDINYERLVELIREREQGRRSYWQGRIDEFCAQNALDQSDYPHLDLRLK